MILILAGGAVQARPEYDVAAVKPNLTADAQTTLLVDFSKPVAQAVQKSSGQWSLPVQESGIAPSQGLIAPLQIPVAGHLDPASFTMEMILKPDPDATHQTPIAQWSAPKEFTTQLGLGGFRMRLKDLEAAVSIGGNGHGIDRDAPNQWVYLALGVDMVRGQVAVTARNMEGRLLSERMEFMDQDGLLKEIDPNVFASQAAANDQWKQAAQRVADLLKEGQPVTFTIGHEQVVIQALRISKGFRSAILLPSAQPKQDQGKILGVKEIDAARAKPVVLTRMVGTNDYNQRRIRIQEQQLTLTPGGESLKVQVPNLPASLYVVHLYGQLDPKGRDKLARIWSPCPIEFAAHDAQGQLIASGHRLAKQSFSLQRLQGFEFHQLAPGPITLTFKLPSQAQESLQLVYLNLIDKLEGLPDEAIKTAQNLGKNEAQPQQLKELTTERRQRDDDIWAAHPPLNQHWQVHGVNQQFRNPPADAPVARYALASSGSWDGKQFNAIRYLDRPEYSFKPLDMINTQTGEIFPHAKVVAGEPWPGELADDGTGIFLRKEKFPELPHDIYYAPRAVMFGQRLHSYLGLLGTWDHRGASLPDKYAKTGDPEVGHDAAMALIRLAYDWPALEMNLHEHRLATHSPDLEFNTDWSNRRNGKYFYEGWSGSTSTDLMQSYDRIFPYIKDNQVLADAAHRFIPWVKTPTDVVRFLDRYLVFASVRDYREGLIRAAPVEEVAGQVLGPHKLTAPLFDMTRQQTQIYPFQGTYQDLYATALSRCGSYYIASFMVYAYGDATSTIERAYRLKQFKAKGMPTPMDLSDVNRYRKVRAAGNFLLDMWPAGGFPFMVGDASGGPHTGHEAWKRLAASREAHEQMFDLYPNPRQAYVLKRLGSTDPAVLAAAENQKDPILHNPSRVVPDWGAFLEMNPEQTDLTRRTAATLRLGIGQGHAHSDFLDLNLFAMGLPIAVDLACRSEGSNWSRPSASWSFLHNHAIAHDTEDPRNAGGQNGEPRLTAYAPPVLRGHYANADGSEQLDRDVVLMPIGEPGEGAGYAFDLQRLRGRQLHTWCFHGCESDDLQINADMKDQTVRWIDRTLKPHRVGKAGASVQAVWTMTRQSREIPHDFNGGGVIKTAACEPQVLGNRYDPNLPLVRVRATLLNQEGATVMQGSPFSQAYSYAFPFLWVQKQAQGESVFPAVYDWYRGEVPTVSRFEQVAGQDQVYQVTTSSGQIDTFTCGKESLSVVSRDAKGLRWIKLVGGQELKIEGLDLRAEKAQYQAKVADIDYLKGTLTLDQPLPANTYAMIGNPARTSYLFLHGQGVERKFDDDLLIHQSTISKLKVSGEDAIEVSTPLNVFRSDAGNRKVSGMTQTNEDHTWHFRAGKVIRKPAGATLTDQVFTDANGDGQVQLKTYELGIGDEVKLPVDVEMRRSGTSWQVKTNVAVTVTLPAGAKTFQPAADWQNW